MTGGKLLQDAMGMIDEKYIAEVINPHPSRMVRRRSIARLASLAACLCLLIGTAFGIMLPRTSSKHDRTYPTEALPPVDLDQIVWGTEPSAFDAYSSYAVAEDSLVSMQQNGWELSGELYLTMKNADPYTYFAILVSRGYDYNDMMRFSYQGKTRGEWEVEKEILSAHQRKLIEFSKEGHWLQYGEALYTTGTPDGEKWTKELYEERINFYGAYFLEQYIVNGSLLSEKIEQEIRDNEARLKEISVILVQLEDAYAEHYAHEDFEKFTEKGLYCAIKNGRLYLFITPRGLSKLRMQGKSKYTLSLANRRAFESEEHLPSAWIDENLTGFICEKLSFYTDGVRYNTVSTDSEVIEATKYLLERWQYTTDFLHVVIYANPRLNEEQLAPLGCEGVYFSTYTDMILLKIPLAAFNLTAIRDLSLLPEVSSIHLSPPLTVVN